MKRLDEGYLKLINEALRKTVHKITLPIAVGIVTDILAEIFPEKSFDDLYEMILFKTNPSLSFPKSDIESILFIKDEGGVRVEIIVNFLGIFGACSPMPLHYAEEVYSDSLERRVLTDFLDMLNHRLKRLVYPIWRKYRYYVQYNEDLSDNFSKYVLSLMGLYVNNVPSTRYVDLKRLIPFASLLTMRQTSSASLQTILKHYFKHEHITVEEGVVSEARFPASQHVMLGESNCAIGFDMTIGEFALTRNNKIRIIFRDVSPEMLKDIAPSGSRRAELEELLSLVLKIPFDYELVLGVSSKNTEPFILGGDICLGVNGWLECSEEEMTVAV